MNQHEEWKNNKLVKSFKLPQASEDKHSKYGAKKVEVNKRIFDSIMEARFYVFLLELKKDKQIASFDCQVPFELQEKYKDNSGEE